MKKNFIKKDKKNYPLPLSLNVSYILEIIECYSNTVIVKEIDENIYELYLIFKHNHKSTLLDFTNSKDYRLTMFDENLNICGYKYATKSKAPFIICTACKSILIEKIKVVDLNKKKIYKTIPETPFINCKTKYNFSQVTKKVSESEFLKKDDLIPLLVMNQHRIYPDKYKYLKGLDNYKVAFVSVILLSGIESKPIIIELNSKNKTKFLNSFYK